jgi:hypothetical protein
VDQNEIGYIQFSTVGTGNLILELAEKIDHARKVLEEDYHLGDHEDEIRALNEKRLAEKKRPMRPLKLK